MVPWKNVCCAALVNMDFKFSFAPNSNVVIYMAATDSQYRKKGYFRALVYNASKKHFKDEYCTVFVIVPHAERGDSDPTLDPDRFNHYE